MNPKLKDIGEMYQFKREQIIANIVHEIKDYEITVDNETFYEYDGISLKELIELWHQNQALKIDAHNVYAYLAKQYTADAIQDILHERGYQMMDGQLQYHQTHPHTVTGVVSSEVIEEDFSNRRELILGEG